MQPLAQPPRKDDGRFDDWMFRLWKRIADTAGLAWSLVDKTGSNLTDIETRNHADLQNINTATYTHLSATNHTDLTDAGDSTLHYHAADRNTDNHSSGTTNKVFTAIEQTKLAGIETGAEVNNISDVNATYLTDSGETTLHGHKWPMVADTIDVSETVTVAANRQLIIAAKLTNNGTLTNNGRVHIL